MRTSIGLVVSCLYFYSGMTGQVSRPNSIVTNDGKLMATSLIVKLNSPAFTVDRGRDPYSVEELGSEAENFRRTLQSLQEKIGPIRLTKRVPQKSWGDTLRPSARTGRLVKVPDLSQIYTLSFAHYVEIGSILRTLNTLPEVLYCDPPIHGSSFADEPNDDLFDLQYSLEKIEALKAWDDQPPVMTPVLS